MQSAKGYLPGALLFVAFVLVGSQSAARAGEDDEARFGALRAKVAALEPHEPEEVRQQIEKFRSYIVECPVGEPRPDSWMHVGVEGVEYAYANPARDEEAAESDYCFWVGKPLNRPLSAAEGRDFAAALRMPDLQRFMPGLPTPEERAARAKIGERHLMELRAIVARGEARTIDPEIALSTGVHGIGNIENLVDCSQVPAEELDRRIPDVEHGDDGARTLYNDDYSWIDLDPHGARCIYVTFPLHRGLTVEEARDFLAAQQLDIGYSDEFRKQFDPDGTQLPPNPVGPPAAAGKNGASEKNLTLSGNAT